MPAPAEAPEHSMAEAQALVPQERVPEAAAGVHWASLLALETELIQGRLVAALRQVAGALLQVPVP